MVTFVCNHNHKFHINKNDTFIKTDNRTHIDKYRIAANITEFYESKLIYLRISSPEFIMIRQLFHVKNIKSYQYSLHTVYRSSPVPI